MISTPQDIKQLVILSSTIILVFISRFCYNFIPLETKLNFLQLFIIYLLNERVLLSAVIRLSCESSRPLYHECDFMSVGCQGVSRFMLER